MSGYLGLEGKRALVTGGTKGVGQAVVAALREAGATALTTARSQPECLSNAEHFVVADVSTVEGCAAVADAVRDRLGGIDIVVNNASAIALTPVVATDMKRFDLMHQINARGTFVVSKWAIGYLEKAANPHILMISPPLARLTWLNEGFCDFTLLRIRHDDPFGNPRWLQSRHEPAFFQLNRARTRLKSAVQPAEQPNQKNNRQWNAEKPK